MSLITAIALSAALHLYVGSRLVPQLPLPAGIALGLLLAASALLMPAGLLARRLLRPPASDRLTWVGMSFMGLFSTLLVLTLARDLVLLAAGALGYGTAGLADESAAAVPLL